MSINVIVSVFLAGVQKAGTTTLFTYLSQHPQLAAPREKETHFFDDERRDWERPDYHALGDWFPHQRGDAVRFDATPIYLFWPPAMARIHRYNPAARLILIFRDPVERAISQWRMERARGTEPLAFGDAIRAEAARLASSPLESREWRDRSYLARGRYGEQIARVLALFSPSQMLLLRSDDLARGHAAVLAQIAAFLTLDPFPPLSRVWARRSVNDEKVHAADRAFARDLLADDMRLFRALGGPPMTG